MENKTNRVVGYIALMIIGIAGVILSGLEYADPYISGFGGALFGIALAKLLKVWKMKRNPEYAQKLEIANHDERNIYISRMAYVLSFEVTMAVLVVAGVALTIAGQKEYGFLCFMVVCLQTVLYFVSYLIFQKKY